MRHISYGRWYFSGVFDNFSWIISLTVKHFSLQYRGWYIEMGGPVPDDMDFLEP
jgi:hypothetical protein